MDESVVDPQLAGARTESEQPLVASLISQGAVFDFDRTLGIPVSHRRNRAANRCRAIAACRGRWIL